MCKFLPASQSVAFDFLGRRRGSAAGFPGGQAENTSEFPGLRAKPVIRSPFVSWTDSVPLGRASSLSA